MHVVKKVTEMRRFLRITVKRLAPCWCLDGRGKEPYEMSMTCESMTKRRSNFFSQPANKCAVTCITEISLVVTLYKQPIHSLTPMSEAMMLVAYVFHKHTSHPVRMFGSVVRLIGQSGYIRPIWSSPRVI